MNSYRSNMNGEVSHDSNHQGIASGHHGHNSMRSANGHHFADAGVASMMNQMAGLSLGGPSMPHHAAGISGHGAYMLSPDYVLASMSSGHPISFDGYASGPSAYVGHGGYGNYMMPMMPYTPGRAHLMGGRDRHSDVPGLENRRGSYSTIESTPTTPYYATHREHGPRIAALDRSTYTTPSPQQLSMGALQSVDPNKNVALSSAAERNLDELLKKDPVVPKAVPAVFTPPGQMKSLEQSLENRIPGNRNVYIRGLHPTTDDALLHSFASRFGAVETSKAIIDTTTGACKGFGFAKFYDVRHSELCIRGFHRLGYEVGFARESFNSRLKAEGDDLSTNLYISNLPKNVGEVELGNIFIGYEILSSKILRDSMGNSRGVGFARFESRDVCDAIIKEFHGLSIGDEGLQMNIRYADTPAQKELKRVTAERRQFRTNEYNIGAYGTTLVGYQPNMFGGQTNGWRRQASGSSSALHTPTRLMGASERSSSGGSSQRIQAMTHRRALTSSDAVAGAPSMSSATDECAAGSAEHKKLAMASAQSSPSAKKEKK